MVNLDCWNPHWYGEHMIHETTRLHALMYIIILIGIILCVELLRKRSEVYLVDYACMNYTEEAKTSVEVLLYFMKGLESVSTKDLMFQTKVFLKSGLGEEAYVPRETLQYGRHVPEQASLNQVQLLVVGAVDKLLRKARITPNLIDILIVNSGLFNPTPSLSSRLVEHFKMREDIKSFHLSGMGCSASLISIDLAKKIFESRNRANGRRPRYALIVSTELLQQLYDGKDRSMMVTNCLFRSAGNAILLSNNPKDKPRCKMQLTHLLRVNIASDDEAHNVVTVKEDEEGVLGAKLHPNLINVATKAIRINMTKLAPKVLPLGELLKVGVNKLKRRLLKMNHVKAYVPNFKLSFDHFCIHPGSKAVIEGVGKSLALNDYDIEPSLMGLHRFGNTSCCGIWYELAYIEAKKRLKVGDKVWQIGLGSGFKCNSAVWTVLRTLDEPILEDNPWHDCIHRYPVHGDLSNLPHVIRALQLVLE